MDGQTRNHRTPLQSGGPKRKYKGKQKKKPTRFSFSLFSPDGFLFVLFLINDLSVSTGIGVPFIGFSFDALKTLKADFFVDILYIKQNLKNLKEREYYKVVQKNYEENTKIYHATLVLSILHMYNKIYHQL